MLHNERGFTFLVGGTTSEGAHMNWMRCAERLSDAECDDAIEACRQFDLVSPAVVGEERLPGHRRVDARMLTRTDRTSWIFELIEHVAKRATDEAYGIELSGIVRPPQYVEYHAGRGGFDWHNDYSHGLPDAPRKLTVIVQLSASGNYEGGELQVMSSGIEVVPKDRGTIVVFPSILMHRVTPITSGTRRALVSWIGGPRHV
jgi:PKHD-type hydroxylase